MQQAATPDRRTLVLAGVVVLAGGGTLAPAQVKVKVIGQDVVAGSPAFGGLPVPP